ncbi:hypothetical protein EMPS_07817 [Entomortierella parvispora]|uniref:Uncharacterized protein n=1 Tax=Entomortierella parvispora TaxID=205924 RepID=A0A9P3LYQ3_9FUNG|nr:hypothetical protein EMPS_07817 [Entomortierella parvispora]
MKYSYLFFFSLVIFSVAVMAVTAEEPEPEETEYTEKEKLEKKLEELHTIFCKTERGVVGPNGPDQLRDDFNSCLACCQSMSPMSALDDYQARVRKRLTGSREFTDAYRKTVCDGNQNTLANLVAYSKEAKQQVNAKLLPEYSTEAGLVAFYDSQYKCYQNCRDSATPADKKFCIPFKLDPNAEVCDFQRDFRKPTAWEHITLNFDQLHKDLEKGTYICRTSSTITKYRVDSYLEPRDKWVKISTVPFTGQQG